MNNENKEIESVETLVEKEKTPYSDQPKNELGHFQSSTTDTELTYKGELVPKKSNIMGVKLRERGAYKGKWQAICQTPEGHIFTGPYRETKGEALMDVSMAKARVYV